MIDVLIITFNEELNIPHCLAALQGWANKVFVVDSGSTDGTKGIVESYHAEFVHHDWEGYSRQKNWALNNLPFESEWILIVDADEVITAGVQKRLIEIASRSVTDVEENGFFINRLTYFMDRPIRHCGYFPSWNMRFFKRGKGLYEDRAVHEHIIIDDPVGYIRQAMIHNDRRGLEHYIAKHNRYSTLEARTLFEEMTGQTEGHKEVNIARQAKFRRWLKRNITPNVPFAGMWRFLYVYVFRLGILDGRVGMEFCKFIGMYDALVAMKLRALRRSAKIRQEISIESKSQGLAIAEGDDPVLTTAMLKRELPSQQGDNESSGVDTTPAQTHPESSPWSFREKVGRALWMVVGRPIFRMSFHNWYRFRATLLRWFGAKIGKGVAIRPTVNIEVPWMIEIQDDATIGDYAILYSLGKITIGERAIISQYAHLCAGTHDYTDHTFRLLRTPVTICHDVWIGADAFIGPGVTVKPLSVVGARSSTYKDLGERQVFVGNPAKPVKERMLK